MKSNEQTRAEANRQVRMLMQNCVHEERLKNHVKPIPESVQARDLHQGGPVHVSALLPDVMAGIQRRRARRNKQDAGEATE